MVDWLKRPETELKNTVWHIKVFKGKISIEHRPSGQKLENLTIEDLKNLSAIVGSAVITIIEGE
jgi:hypothetical protein